MIDLLLVMLVGLVMALPVYVAGRLAERVTAAPALLSAAWQIAAGMILAIVGFSLMPAALRIAPALPVMLAFFAGGALFALVDVLVSRPQPPASGGGAGPAAGLFAGVLIDLAIDGVVIGIGSTVSLANGLVLAAGMAVSTAPLVFVAIATARQLGIPLATRQQYAVLCGGVVLVGAGLGFLLLRDQPPVVRYLLLAAAAGFLTTLVTQTMIPEALRTADSRWAAVYFVAGLSVYALLTLLV